jgi:hypothetical protein
MTAAWLYIVTAVAVTLLEGSGGNHLEGSRVMFNCSCTFDAHKGLQDLALSYHFLSGCSKGKVFQVLLQSGLHSGLHLHFTPRNRVFGDNLYMHAVYCLLAVLTGMQQSLPQQVRLVMQRAAASGPGGSSSLVGQLNPATLPMALEIESRDPRTTSDVILQLLSYRPASTSDVAGVLMGSGAAASCPTCMYFTMQFYRFGPSVTEPVMLSAQADDASGQHVLLPVSQVWLWLIRSVRMLV